MFYLLCFIAGVVAQPYVLQYWNALKDKAKAWWNKA
jgi:hypothetical protein